MIPSLCAVLVLAAAAPDAGGMPRTAASHTETSILVLDVAGTEGDPEAKGLSPLLVSLVEERTELRVTPASAVRDRLSLASEKVEAGCDAAACMAEVAGAIGARFVLFSRYTRSGDLRLLRMEAFDDGEQRTVSVVTVRAESTGSLLEELPRAVSDLVARSDGALPVRESASPVVQAPGFFDRPGNALLVAGAAASTLGVLSVVVFGLFVAAASDSSGALDDAVTAYEDDPNADTAADVAREHTSRTDSQNLLVATSPLLVVGALGIFGGAGCALVALVQKGTAE